MTFAAAWALLGLAALPLLVVLHRRRRRPAPVVVPSLLFLEGEPATAEAPERVRLDGELLLALAAAACLALAAAGPRLAARGPGVVVRVVRRHGAWEQARPGGVGETLGARGSAAWEALRDEVARRGGRLDTVHAFGGDREALAAARDGTASLRVIVGDRLLDPDPLGVRVVAVGESGARNLGVVAIDVGEGRLFANVWNDGAARERVRVVVEAAPAGGAASLLAERTVELPPFAAGSASFDVAGGLPPRTSVSIRPDPADDLPADDGVVLERLRVRVGFDSGAAGYSERHRRAVWDGLETVLGEDLVARDDERADLWVGPPETSPKTAAVTLLLRPLGPGDPGTRPPPGAAFDMGLGPIARDLDPAGCDFVYAQDPTLASPYPVVVTLPARTGSVIAFVPDPLAGTPAPVDHPIWPIFLENLVALRLGRPGPLGHRVIAGVDPLGLESTRLGRDVRPFDASWLDDARPVGAVRARDLRPPLAGAALALLAGLWAYAARAARARHATHLPAGARVP